MRHRSKILLQIKLGDFGVWNILLNELQEMVLGAFFAYLHFVDDLDEDFGGYSGGGGTSGGKVSGGLECSDAVWGFFLWGHLVSDESYDVSGIAFFRYVNEFFTVAF